MLISDERLTRRAIDGDRSAFSAIFRRYQESLYRYCLAIVGNREDAQDALQSTMVKVLRALPGEERRIELKPWLYRIAHNESIDLIRRRRPSEELDPELVAGGAGLAEEAAQRQRLGRLLADLDQLPKRQRGVLVMRELGGLEFEQIGAALGTSAAAARQTLYEARLGLRQMDAGRELSCDEVMRAISDADGRVLRRRDIRAHLRGCESCQSFRAGIDRRRRDLAALSPLPAAAAAGLLQGLLGGGAGGGGGIAAALGGGAAKSVAGSAFVKGAATVAAVAVIGVAAADRGGLVHVGLPGSGGDATHRNTVPAGSATPAVPTIPTGQAQSGADPTVKPASAAAEAGAEIGRAKAAAKASRNDAEPVPSPGSTSPTAVEAPSGGPQLPSASAHGRHTAATHKAAKGASQPSHPGHPAKPAHAATPGHPVHPTHPSTPSATKPSPPTVQDEKTAPAEKAAGGSEAAAAAGENADER